MMGAGTDGAQEEEEGWDEEVVAGALAALDAVFVVFVVFSWPDMVR